MLGLIQQLEGIVSELVNQGTNCKSTIEVGLIPATF